MAGVSSFTRARFEPTGRTAKGRAVWRICEPFRFDIGFEGSGLAVEVPAGFETDGPSIPAWALRIVEPGAMIRSAAVHDLLLADRRFSTIEAAAVFLTAMAAEGVPRWQREIAFVAVRLHRPSRTQQVPA